MQKEGTSPAKCATNEECKAPEFVVEKSPLHCQETSEKTVLSIDVAGFTVDQLTVEIDSDVLTVSGKRTNRLGDTFSTRRRFTLKANVYDTANVLANLTDGVLEVTIKKRPELKSRKIPISLEPLAISVITKEDQAEELRRVENPAIVEQK